METDLSTPDPDALLAIFDHDGVLVDTLKLHQDSWFELGRRTGLKLTPEFIHETFGMTNPTILKMVLGDEADDARIAELENLKETSYRDLARGRIALMDGVRETLNALTEAGVLLAIGSSGVRENLELTVSECGLSGRFATIVSGGDVTKGKPDPQVFLIAADRAGVSPARTVVFEDAPVGIQAAKAAGMLAVGVASSHPNAALWEAGADEVVADLKGYDAAALIDRLRKRGG